ncbi:MAG: hypothetical protein HY270_13485 [Deltaproteobacteria bacterium]|nr:hypothetical protein [Deltaproteobacteria bacterium]
MIDAAPFIAGALAVLVLLGGTLSACRRGGACGLLGFLAMIGVAAVVYVVVMVRVEVLKVLLDVEQHGRERLSELRRMPADPQTKQSA